MVPGLVAGLYEHDDCAIDLRRLCDLAGVAFLQAEINGLNLAARQLLLEGRPPLGFERLSLNVGAVTVEAGGARSVKPLEPFLAWGESLSAGRSVTLRGGGAAAVELALALKARGIASRLLLRGRQLHLGSPAANRAGERLLAEAGIPVERDVPAGAAADLACTGSRAPDWLATSGLTVDPATGRVLTHPSLAVLDHPDLFACGDCGLIALDPRPASGVWAVRAAPALAANLKRSLEHPGTPLKPWRPQAQALQLLGDGGVLPDGPRALAFWGPLALGPSRWLWRWKDRIDRRFMQRFADLAPMAASMTDPKAAPMACRGCAAKLAAAPLAAALARLDPEGVTPPAQDAAVVHQGVDGVLLQSVDGFPALVDDPWLNGRLTTLHACSDLWASGAVVESVQALVTLPEAAPPIQADLLLQTLAGVRSMLEPLGARLIGGHTLEGRDGAGLSLALTVNGRVAPGIVSPADHSPAAPWPKGPLLPGDVLLLSRPIGTGVLFAAAMAGEARPAWIDAALAVMQQSQAPLVSLLAAHGCHACTDITGFGLLGHLGEMVAAGAPGEGVRGVRGQRAPAESLRVYLDAAAVPALPGALELLERGFASSLAPANATALALLEGPIRLREAGDGPGGSLFAARQALLIDPQTCGPLLAALPAERAASALEAMRAEGFSDAAVIGTVITTA
jgi:selenide,water dikinase